MSTTKNQNHHHRFSFFIASCGLLATSAFAGSVRAEEPAAPPPPPALGAPAAEAAAPSPAATAVTTATPGTPATPAPPPPPYSIPWQLRPVAAANALRSDTAIAFYDNGMGASGSTVASMFLASYKVTPSLAPMVRLGVSQNDGPAMVPDGTSFVNPIVGATFAKRIDSIRWAAFLGATIPIGSGGGNSPDPGAAAANAAGIRARSAMDNAMFAVNYFTAIAGGGDRLRRPQAHRAAGGDAVAAVPRPRRHRPVQPDSTRTNSTVGLHAGYFILPVLSVGGELRYQRWLSSPTRGGPNFSGANMDTLTMAIGPRAHFQVGKGLWLRPGLAYARGLDMPLTTSSYNMIQVDVPFVF